MKQKNYIKIFIFLILSASFFCASSVRAASISFASSTVDVYQGREFYVDVMINPQNEDINTVSADIEVPSNLLYISNSNIGSIIGEWVDAPAILNGGKTIHFSGIIPGGFLGYINPFDPKSRSDGLLVRLFFKPVILGDSTLLASNEHIYLNDGQGTETSSSANPIVVHVLQGASVEPRVSTQYFGGWTACGIAFLVLSGIIIWRKWTIKRKHTK